MFHNGFFRFRGWIVAPRWRVPSTLDCVLVSFSGEVEIGAKVIFCHPTLQFTLLQYDPMELFSEDEEIAKAVCQVHAAKDAPKLKNSYKFYGLGRNGKQLSAKSNTLNWFKEADAHEPWPAVFEPRNQCTLDISVTGG